MEKSKFDQGKQSAGTMLQQKTNEDFNKKKPDPSDPNEKDRTPGNDVPDIGDDDLAPLEGEAIDPKNDQPDMEEDDSSTDDQTSEDKTAVREPEVFKYTGSE